jgi:hypothetical protein
MCLPHIMIISHIPMIVVSPVRRPYHRRLKVRFDRGRGFSANAPRIRREFSDNLNDRGQGRSAPARKRSPINLSFTIQHCVHHASRMRRGE